MTGVLVGVAGTKGVSVGVAVAVPVAVGVGVGVAVGWGVSPTGRVITVMFPILS